MLRKVVLRDAAAGQWLLFHAPEEVLIAHDVVDVMPVLSRAEQRVTQQARDGRYTQYDRELQHGQPRIDSRPHFGPRRARDRRAGDDLHVVEQRAELEALVAHSEQPGSVFIEERLDDDLEEQP